jgi:mannose-6-phosphate isomerase-like protein (cupin superfamily)
MALSDALCWRQNPNYADQGFLDGYAYCELLGPTGHLFHDNVSVGLLLLQPDLIYPEHSHPATETYVVLSGHAQWRQGNASWRARAPGEIIHHTSMEAHAMHSGNEPLLAAYLWQGDLSQAARLMEPV